MDDAIPPAGGPIAYTRPDGTRGIVSIDLGSPIIDPRAPSRIPDDRATPRGVVNRVGLPYRPQAPQPDRPSGSDPDFDNPVIGGKFTVFTLLFGDFIDMHRRCLGSLVSTLGDEPGRSELRVISNALGSESRRYVKSLVDRGSIAAWTEYPDNRLKYVAMRRAFNDPDRPITTPYLIWADDDTMFDVDRGWLRKLAVEIRDHHGTGHRLYGPHYTFNLTPHQATWYMASAAYGGDVWIGWAVRQAGGKLRPFSNGKSPVRWSAFKRRGYSEPHPGLK